MSNVEMRIEEYSIKDIYELLDDRIFAIPKLQRDFVWNNKKVIDLCDSIYRNLPIGTILIWETQRANCNLLKKSLTALPPYNNSNANVWFILDGQQRISVLHGMKQGLLIENSVGKKVEFDKLYFTMEGADQGKYALTKRHDPAKQVLISDILSTNWSKLVKQYKKTKSKYNRIKTCRDKIMSYPVPFVLFESKNIDDVKEVFIRINGLGTPLKTADKIFSRAAEIDLRHLAKAAKLDWKYGYSTMPDSILQQVLAFDLGKVEVGERAVGNAIENMIKRINETKSAAKSFSKQWNKIKHAIGLAIDYLRKKFFVIEFSLLPSTTMIATLAMFFIYNKNKQPDVHQQKMLRQWFWTTAIAIRYSGKGYRDNIIADVRYFKKLAENNVSRFIFKEKVPETKILHADYLKGSALAKAVYCLLISKNPRYLDSPDEIPLDAVCSTLNKKQRHHVFPQKLMNTNGFSSKEINRISNICFIVAKENPSIGKAKPREYLKVLDGRRREAFLKSHILPLKKNSALWSANVRKDYKKFLKERSTLLCREIERQAGRKIFSAD